jgi:hypothetical protein
MVVVVVVGGSGSSTEQEQYNEYYSGVNRHIFKGPVGMKVYADRL